MADLRKFIRQQFSETNWSKQCDLLKISRGKLCDVAATFNQLDLKSKLMVILTYSNSPVPEDSEVEKLVESAIAQSLCEDDNFVKCISTVLHTRPNFGYLHFDLSDTDDTFAATVQSLKDYAKKGKRKAKCKMLLFAEIGRDKGPAVPRRNSAKRNNGCLNSRQCFKAIDTAPWEDYRTSLLERLTEDCDRRRVHVPIPGRGLRKRDDSLDPFPDSPNQPISASQGESFGGWRRAPSFPRRAPGPSKAVNAEKLPPTSSTPAPSNTPSAAAASAVGTPFSTPPTASATLNPPGSATTPTTTSSGATPNTHMTARARLLAMHMKGTVTPTGGGLGGGGGEKNGGKDSKTPATSRRAMILSSLPSSENPERGTTAGGKRSGGIKLLDFQEQPAIGIQAKKLRKEQQEKEREEKRRERLQKAQERRAEREATRRSRMLAQASATTATASAASAAKKTLGQNPLVPVSLPGLRPITSAHLQQPPMSQQPTKLLAWDIQQPWTPFTATVVGDGSDLNGQLSGGGQHARQQQLLQQMKQQQQHEEDEDEDFEEEEEPVIGPDGAYHLTAPRGFRGFTEVVSSGTGGPTLVFQQGQRPLGPTASASTTTTTSTTSTPLLFQRPRTQTQPILSATAQQPQTATSGGVFQTVSGGTQIRLLRPWQPATQRNGSETTTSRLVQLPDGRFALAQTPAQPQTLLIASPGSATTGQPVLIRSPLLTSTGTPQQQQAAVPQNTARLQPRLIQIRPRAPAVTSSTTVPIIMKPLNTSTSGAGVTVINPSSTAAAAAVAASNSPALQPRIVIANPSAAGGTPQPTLMRIVPRPAQQTQQQQQILPQPVVLTQTSSSSSTSSSTAATTTAAAAGVAKEGVLLTNTQLNSIHSLFQGANRLSRPDKAIILSFVSGVRDNPHPENGNAVQIRLSEYRECVVDRATGKAMEVAADTFLHLDYATGKFERVKYYRKVPPEQLLALPPPPKPTTATAAFVSAPP